MITDVIYWEGVNNYQIMAYATSTDGKEQTSNKSNLSFVEVTDKYPHAENLQAIRKENKLNISWDEVEGADSYYVTVWKRHGTEVVDPPYEIEEVSESFFEYDLDPESTYVKVSVIPESSSLINNWKNMPDFFKLSESSMIYKDNNGNDVKYVASRWLNEDVEIIDGVVLDNTYSTWATNEDGTYDVYFVTDKNLITQKYVPGTYLKNFIPKEEVEERYFKGWDSDVFADNIQAAIDYADGDPAVFTNDLKRRCNSRR